MAHAQGGARGMPSFQERGGRDRPCAPLAFCRTFLCCGLPMCWTCESSHFESMLDSNVIYSILCARPTLYLWNYQILSTFLHLPPFWGAGLGGGWIWGRMVCALLWSLRVRSSNGLLNLGCSVHYPLPLMGLETQKFWPYFFLRLYFNDCCMESVWYCI